MSRTDSKISTIIDNDFYDDLGVAGWWNNNGPQHGLHQMNPMRTGYFHERLQAEGVRVLPDKELSVQPLIVEIGCGGGIVSEAMASYGYRIHGIDLSAGSIAVAQSHSTFSTEQLRYTHGNAYDLPLENNYADGIIMSDVLEHLDDLPKAVAEVSRVLKPGWVLLFDTFNRTFSSWFFGILGAQILLGIVPNHCHDWNLFVKPKELDTLLENNNIRIRHLCGFDVAFSPWHMLKTFIFSDQKLPMHFSLVDSLSVQYIGQAVKLSPDPGLFPKDPNSTTALKTPNPERIAIEDSLFLPGTFLYTSGIVVFVAVTWTYCYCR